MQNIYFNKIDLSIIIMYALIVKEGKFFSNQTKKKFF